MTFRRTWPLLTLPLAWLFIQAGGWGAEWLARLAGMHASAASGNWPDNILALFAWGLVAVVLWLWLRFYEHRAFDTLGFTGKGAGHFTAGLILGLVMTVVPVVAIVALGGYVVAGPGAWYDHLTPTWLLASLLTIAGTFIQAGAKEALFRGWIMHTLALRWGTGVAVLLNVVAFVYIHANHLMLSPESLLGVVNLALMAWLLSRLVMRDGSLWGAWGLHAGWTLMTGLGLGLNIIGEHLNVTPMLLAFGMGDEAPWWLSGGDFGPNGSIMMTLVVIGLLVWARPPRRTTRPVHDDDVDDFDS